MRSPGALGLAVVLLLAGPLAAAPEDPPETVPAVGRLNHAGYRELQHCTVSLIAPREAITARHCVEGLPTGDLHVLLGYDRGDLAEHRRVASVEASSGWDIARLCLDAPAAVAPLAASAERPAPGPAETRGYPRSRPHAQDPRTCRLGPMAGRPQAELDCPLEPGMSGSPVVVGEGEAARVIGVASASNATASLVVLLEALPEGGCPPPG